MNFEPSEEKSQVSTSNITRQDVPKTIAIWLGVLVVSASFLFLYNYLSLPKEEIQQIQQNLSENLSGSDLNISTDLNISSDTSGWKTYRNEKFGFELKYPSDWEISEEEKDITYFLYTREDSENFGPMTPPSLTIWVLDSKGMNLEDFFKTENEGWYTIYNKVTRRTEKSYQVIIADDSNAELNHEPIKAAFISKGSGSIIVITADWVAREYFDKILSTFKFIR